MYRYHTTQFHDAITAHEHLSSDPRFKGLNFRKGVLKDRPGVFIIKDLDYKGGYGPAIKVDDCTTIEACQDPELAQKFLPALEAKGGAPIPIKLSNGLQLTIRAATGEPRAFLFSTEEDEGDSPFSGDSPYGRAAIEFCKKQLESTDPISLRDPCVLKLVKMALVKSYPKLPEAFWDASRLVTYDDIDTIICAAIGADPNFLA